MFSITLLKVTPSDSIGVGSDVIVAPSTAYMAPFTELHLEQIDGALAVSASGWTVRVRYNVPPEEWPALASSHLAAEDGKSVVQAVAAVIQPLLEEGAGDGQELKRTVLRNLEQLEEELSASFTEVELSRSI